MPHPPESTPPGTPAPPESTPPWTPAPPESTPPWTPESTPPETPALPKSTPPETPAPPESTPPETPAPPSGPPPKTPGPSSPNPEVQHPTVYQSESETESESFLDKLLKGKIRRRISGSVAVDVAQRELHLCISPSPCQSTLSRPESQNILTLCSSLVQWLAILRKIWILLGPSQVAAVRPDTNIALPHLSYHY